MFEYRLKVLSEERSDLYPPYFQEYEHTILAENEVCYALDNTEYTTIYKDTDRYPSVGYDVTEIDDYKGKGVTYSAYSLEKKTLEDIKKDIKEFLTREKDQLDFDVLEVKG